MLAHLLNSEAGREGYEPVVNQLFRASFLLPVDIKEEPLLTEHIISVTGWKDPSPETVQQQSGSARRNYLSTDVDNTQVLEVTMSLNLNKENQNYILKKIKEWRKKGFNPLTGEYGIKSEYKGELTVERLSKKQEVIYSRTLHNAFCSGELTGIDDFDITNPEPIILTFTVTGDYYTEAEK